MGLISNGTTIFDNGVFTSGGSMVLVSSATASSSASIEFTLGNYKEYQFYFVDIHPSVDDAGLMINFSIDNGSNYNVTKTTTRFYAYNGETSGFTLLGYLTSADLAQSTADQEFIRGIGNDNDQIGVGKLTLFNPSSTTFVKHFVGRSSTSQASDYAEDDYLAGYANTTSALTNIKFQMSSGNIDAGKILMFGIN